MEQIVEHEQVTDAASEGRLWTPNRGTAILGLASKSITDTVKSEAYEILARCVPPTQAKGQRTGLVVGHVQSGKTSSFIAVSALARDNHYNLVVMISGTTTNLFGQSVERLQADLRGASKSGWIFHRSNELKKTNTKEAALGIKSALAAWGDEELHASRRKTIVWSVMKNATHLQHFLNTLAAIPAKDRTQIRALIIDDEADQASMNSKPGEEQGSTVYERLTTIRALLPHCTYLQYTATPQAPLLAHLTDVLSPEFCRVLTPGETYTGGETFFGPESALVREIPDAEVDEDPETPPPSLATALRLFILGLAYDLTVEDTGNRSMMIHPATSQASHRKYQGFAKALVDRWKRELAPDADEDVREQTLATFAKDFEDYEKTVPGLTFDSIKKHITKALDSPSFGLINAAGNKEINWDITYHILTGAIRLDRGFTIEGLMTTYMPRRADIGSVDSVQQRARWFGYKEEYLGFCRVFLTSASAEAYRKILEHENDMRTRLREFKGDLRDFRRVFRNASTLKLTRAAVIGLHIETVKSLAKWFKQDVPQGDNEDLVESNEGAVIASLAGLNFEPFDTAQDWTPIQSHEIARDVPMEVALNLVERFRAEEPNDSARLLAIQLNIEQKMADDPSAFFSLVKISSKGDDWTPRTRNQDNLHQGRQHNGYKGDAAVRDDGLTIQIHKLKRKNGAGIQYALAIWAPSELAQGWTVQVDGDDD